MCGKADSATEAQPFCGACNRSYRASLELDRKERQANQPSCSDDCDVPHCGGCGHHYEPWHGQRLGRCDECSV